MTSYKAQKKITSGERVISLSSKNEDYEYLTGHVIDGKNLIPAIGYLAMIWETMGMLHTELYTEISVVFEDVTFIRATHIPKEGEIQLTVMVQKGILDILIHIKYTECVINNCHYICFNLSFNCI